MILVWAALWPAPAFAELAERNGGNSATSARSATAEAVAPASAVTSYDVNDLADLSLEELLSQQVTSVAKKTQRIGDSPAAVYVISQDAIRNSSAQTVPDLLRMVPGMEVADVQTSATSVSARGFTSRFAANLLVMVDGAAIYSTSISGMFWDQALVPLQDIERIEVIRGPGGSLWGSNSINGIVNIITKQSVDTQGIRIEANLGTKASRAEIGIGQQLSDALSLRIYADFRKLKGLDTLDPASGPNTWQGGLAGIRFDYAPNQANNLVGLAEHSAGHFTEFVNQVSLLPTAIPLSTAPQYNAFSTNHLLARWHHLAGANFDFTAQGYINDLKRTEFGARVDRQLVDLSFEGRWRASAVHEFNFGLAGRESRDAIAPSAALTLPGGVNTDRWLTGYVQDEIALVSDRLRLTLGSKFERNSFTGFEIQPNVRLLVRTSPKLAFWGAISRAVLTPLLLQREMITNVTLLRSVPGFPTPLPVNNTFNGSPSAQSERVTAYEAGFRGSLGHRWSYDISAFYNRYDRLTTASTISTVPILAPGIPVPIGLQINNLVTNLGAGQSIGAEFLINGRMTSWWTAEGSYSYLDLHVSSPPQTYVLSPSGPSSRHQLRWKNRFEIASNVALDTELHYVSASIDKLRPAYTDLDLQLSHALNEKVELVLSGRNLLKPRRLEYFQDTLPIALVYVPRSAFVEFRFRL